MADTVTIRIDTDTEHVLAVLTRDGTNRSEAIRQALLEAAVRRERHVEMKRAFLCHPCPRQTASTSPTTSNGSDKAIHIDPSHPGTGRR